MAARRCTHCRLTEEDSLLNQIISGSIPLPKYHPNLAEKELDLKFMEQPTEQDTGSPEMIGIISDLMVEYAEKGFDVRRQIMGEDMVHFALKYRLNSQAVDALLHHGAESQNFDRLGFSPFRVAILDLPNSKSSLLSLLRHGINLDLEHESYYDTYEERKQHPLRIMCARSPDFKTSQILKTFLSMENALPERRNDSDYRYDEIMHDCLHLAIDHKAHVKVVKTLIRHGAPIYYGPGIAYSMVGKAVLASRPAALQFLISKDASVAARGVAEMNPLFVSIQQAIDTCESELTLEQVLNDDNFQCMSVLLDTGAYVNEIGCRFTSKNHAYRYWETFEAQYRGYEEPEVLTAMSAFYKNKEDGRRRLPNSLTSYTNAPQYPSIYFLLLALEKIVDAGALPNRGELPKDIVEWLFYKYADSDDEKLREAVLIVFNKLLTAGFDLFLEDFTDRYVVSQTDINPEWTMPKDEAQLLERLRENHFQPKSLKQITLINFRELMAYEEEVDQYSWENPNPFMAVVDSLLEPPPTIKNLICLRNIRSLSDLWEEEIKELES